MALLNNDVADDVHADGDLDETPVVDDADACYTDAGCCPVLVLREGFGAKNHSVQQDHGPRRGQQRQRKSQFLHQVLRLCLPTTVDSYVRDCKISLVVTTNARR